MSQANQFRVPNQLVTYMPDVSREDARYSWFENPQKRLKAELFCFLLIFVPHPYNNNLRKGLTVVLFIVWSIIEIGAFFGLGAIPDQFVFVRGLVLILLGRMWGLELKNFAGVEFVPLNNDNDDE